MKSFTKLLMEKYPGVYCKEVTEDNRHTVIAILKIYEDERRLKVSKQIKRWFRAIAIAKILFEEEGYHCTYLKEIEEFDIVKSFMKNWS